MAKATADQTAGATMAGAKVDPSRVEPHDPYGHGHSVAAWVAVTTVMIGSLIACLGVGFAIVPVAIIGGVIALAGGPVGKILGAMGLGAARGSTR